MALLNPKAVVNGDAESTSKLMRGDYLVPAYQRDYVWQEKHVGQLWDDIFDHYKRISVNDDLVASPDGYFLGAMVVIESKGEEQLEVVDGQQRLTTLTTIVSVLLDVIREYLPENDPARNGYENTLTVMLGKFENGAWKTNVQFADQDLGQFFLHSCLVKKRRDEKNAYWQEAWCASRIAKKRSPVARLKAAIDVGYDRLGRFLTEQADPNLRKNRLVSLIRLTTEAIVVLKITALSYESAYAIFESLNNRSVPLSQADLIKNELLKHAAPANREEITENWTEVRGMVEGFDGVFMPDFLHYSYLSRFGHARARELYQKVKGQTSTSALAKNYSDELVKDALALDALMENFPATWDAETHQMLKDIKSVLNVKLCYPFLIAAHRKFADVPDDFKTHVRAALNFSFRYIKVLEGSIESFANHVSDAAQMINTGKSIDDIRAFFLKHAPDSEFAAEFATYSTSSVKLAYFAVYYLEKVRMKGALPVGHGMEQHLEHIMPKQPSAKEWPSAATLKNESPEVFKTFLWRIGNLLPLTATINKSIKNRSITYKLGNSTGNHYNSAELNLISPKRVSDFLDGGLWTYKSIEDRQKDLAENWAAKAWPLLS